MSGTSTTILCAPTEPTDLKALGIVSLLPESYGADLLWSGDSGLVAVQRKTIADLLASLQDGRLAHELSLIAAADIPFLLVEGRPRWTSEGLLLDRPFRQTAWWGLLLSVVAGAGIPTVSTDSLQETAGWVGAAVTWFAKDSGEHRSLRIRPKPTDSWGQYNTFGQHLMQSFPGVGPDRAEAIVEHFGGVPLRLTVGEKDLRKVPGVGKVLAKAMVEAMERVAPQTQEGVGV